MVWVPKPGVPAVMRIGDLFSIAATGDPGWSWLIDWVPYMPQELGSTADFCARGPLTHVEPVTVEDMISPFLPFRIDLGIAIAARLTKMRHAMEDRIFADICENQLETGSHCDVLAADTTAANPGDGFGNVLWPVPAGATSIRWTLLVAGTSGFPTIHTQWYTGGSYVGETFAGAGPLDVVGEVQNFPTMGATHLWAWSNAGGMHVKLEACGIGGSTEDYTPIAQEEPEGILPPATRTYEDIADLGAELDRLEFKLDNILAMKVSELAHITTTTTTVATDPLEEAAQVASGFVPISATGLMVVVTGIPGYRSFRGDDPTQYPSLGWLTLRTPWGDYEPRELRHANSIVAPLPPHVDQWSVSVDPPMQAAVFSIGDQA